MLTCGSGEFTFWDEKQHHGIGCYRHNGRYFLDVFRNKGYYSIEPAKEITKEQYIQKIKMYIRKLENEKG